MSDFLDIRCPPIGMHEGVVPERRRTRKPREDREGRPSIRAARERCRLGLAHLHGRDRLHRVRHLVGAFGGFDFTFYIFKRHSTCSEPVELFHAIGEGVERGAEFLFSIFTNLAGRFDRLKRSLTLAE